MYTCTHILYTCIWGSVSQCSLDWPWAQHVTQASFDLFVLWFQLLELPGLQACIISPSLGLFLSCQNQCFHCDQRNTVDSWGDWGARKSLTVVAKLFGCSSFVVLEPLAVSSCLPPAPELSTRSGTLSNVSNISSPVLALPEQLVPLLAPSHSTQLLPFFFFSVMSVRTSFISLWVKFVDSWLICLLFLSISNVFLEKGCLVVRFLKD